MKMFAAGSQKGAVGKKQEECDRAAKGPNRSRTFLGQRVSKLNPERNKETFGKSLLCGRCWLLETLLQRV